MTESAERTAGDPVLTGSSGEPELRSLCRGFNFVASLGK